jgi:hypothetical protein
MGVFGSFSHFGNTLYHNRAQNLESLTGSYDSHIVTSTEYPLFSGFYFQFGFAVRAVAPQKGIYQFTLSLPYVSAFGTGNHTLIRSAPDMLKGVLIPPLYLFFGNRR